MGNRIKSCKTCALYPGCNMDSIAKTGNTLNPGFDACDNYQQGRNIHTVVKETKLEEFWRARGIVGHLGNYRVVTERDFPYEPTLEDVVDFLEIKDADFVSVQHNYRKVSVEYRTN